MLRLHDKQGPRAAAQKSAGVWIDHRRAVLVTLDGDHEELVVIASGVEPRVRFHAHVRSDRSRSPRSGSAEDTRERRHRGELTKYYDTVARALGDAGRLYVFGPGEAKREFATRLAHLGHAGRIVAVETTGLLREASIQARVRVFFAAGGREAGH
jgi:stalled ribosome rescue protein Dom34